MVIRNNGSKPIKSIPIPLPILTKENEILDTSISDNHFKTHSKLSYLASLIKKKDSAVIVISGAGISVNAGIPDFRSQNTGLYNLVEEKFPGILKKGQHLFDASIISSSSTDEKTTKSFFTFIGMLRRMCESAPPTITHSFFAFLNTSQKLLRIYTQNIDSLEKKVSLPKEKVISLHGSLDSLSCTICSYTQQFKSNEHQSYESFGTPLQCPSCLIRVNSRISSGKRALPTGILSPPILLYNHSTSSKNSIPNLEVTQADLISNALSEDQSLILKKKKKIIVIVVGTSCKVVGVRKLIKNLSACSCLSVFINKTPLPQKEWNSVFSFQLIGDCDQIFKELWKLLEPSRLINSYFQSTTFTDEKVKCLEKNGENSSVSVNRAFQSPVKKNLDFYFEKSPARTVRKFSDLKITPPNHFYKATNRLVISPSKSPVSDPGLPFKCTKHNHLILKI